MSTVIHPELLSAIRAYCARHNLSRGAFGRLLMNDPRFVFDIEKGRELRRATIARLTEKMQSPPPQVDRGAA